uniref:Uncharacterized protein n=1 Tax=Lactuca sativa TaxID=4236 RepID=A0A9R1WB64_LACSA|nr:hypothetical protein LSAT_V11C200059230 [Lactuca sativa]
MVHSNVLVCIFNMSGCYADTYSVCLSIMASNKFLKNDCPNHDLPNRAEHFNKLLGVVVPDVVSDVNSHGKRLKSIKEMIEKEISKPKRKCATCGQMAHHDKINCPLKNVHK